jgi:hypothetical protein
MIKLATTVCAEKKGHICVTATEVADIIVQVCGKVEAAGVVLTVTTKLEHSKSAQSFNTGHIIPLHGTL